jgi:hypothetical protein
MTREEARHCPGLIFLGIWNTSGKALLPGGEIGPGFQSSKWPNIVGILYKTTYHITYVFDFTMKI